MTSKHIKKISPATKTAADNNNGSNTSKIKLGPGNDCIPVQ